MNTLQKKNRNVVQDAADIHHSLLAAINAKNNCFITGSAGTGKSYIVNEITKNSRARITLTASTGIAAMNIGGVTVHSWSGINTNNHPHLLDKVVSSKNFHWTMKRIAKTQLLIIDEIGMLTAGQMDLLDEVCRYAIHNATGDYRTAPVFGGIQVILTGDFLQLPPVAKGATSKGYTWAFESKVWKRMNMRTFNLTKIHRQDNVEFCNILNNVRFGVVDPSDMEVLRSRVGKVLPPPLVPTRFVSTNRAVATGNQEELDKASGTLHTFNAESSVVDHFKAWESIILPQVAEFSKMEAKLQVKVGMPVMMLVNRALDDETYNNGSMGVFLGVTSDGSPRVKLHSSGKEVIVSKYTDELKSGDGTPKASMTQYPFRLAHYMTYHKSQGLTLEAVEVDMANVFAPGMMYVGLSRVKTLEGLTIKNFNPMAIKADPKALRFYKT